MRKFIKLKLCDKFIQINDCVGFYYNIEEKTIKANLREPLNNMQFSLKFDVVLK